MLNYTVRCGWLFYLKLHLADCLCCYVKGWQLELQPGTNSAPSSLFTQVRLAVRPGDDPPELRGRVLTVTVPTCCHSVLHSHHVHLACVKGSWVQLRLRGMSVMMQVCVHRSNCWAYYQCDLIMAVDGNEAITKWTGKREGKDRSVTVKLVDVSPFSLNPCGTCVANYNHIFLPPKQWEKWRRVRLSGLHWLVLWSTLSGR